MMLLSSEKTYTVGQSRTITNTLSRKDFTSVSPMVMIGMELMPIYPVIRADRRVKTLIGIPGVSLLDSGIMGFE